MRSTVYAAPTLKVAVRAVSTGALARGKLYISHLTTKHTLRASSLSIVSRQRSLGFSYVIMWVSQYPSYSVPRTASVGECMVVDQTTSLLGNFSMTLSIDNPLGNWKQSKWPLRRYIMEGIPSVPPHSPTSAF